MNGLTLYGTSPFDLIDQMFSSYDFNTAQCRTPAIDVRDEDKRYVIEAELPGLSEKDIKLELTQSTLTLSTAEKAEKEEKDEKGRWLYRGRREFQFSRAFSLPENVDVEKIEAKFRDGILSIALPKKPTAAPRLVPVKVA